MIGYCPAVSLISYFLLYVHQTLLYLDRGRSEFRVERERGFRGKDRLFTALHTDISYIF